MEAAARPVVDAVGVLVRDVVSVPLGVLVRVVVSVEVGVWVAVRDSVKVRPFALRRWPGDWKLHSTQELRSNQVFVSEPRGVS